MFAQVASITGQLRQALGSAWHVHDGTELQPSNQFPAADVRLEGASLGPVSGDGVQLTPHYVVRLAVHKTVGGLGELDTGLSQSISHLHNWCPSGMQQRLSIAGLVEVAFTTSQIFGYELRFVGSESFTGLAE